MEDGSGDDNPLHIQVDSVVQRVVSIVNKTHRTIREVPSRMRDISPNSFKPQKVSIGPLHKNDKNVQEIENLKPLIQRDLLEKVDSPIEETINACEERVYARLDDIKACYGGLHNYSDAELSRMMVMDACFIVFLFLNDEEISHQEDKPYSLSAIYDLVLLENQIPFFVLQDIFNCTVLKFKPSADLNKMLLNILKFVKPFSTYLDVDIHGTNTDYDHILNFLHSSYKRPVIITSRSTGTLRSIGNACHVPAVYSVRELVKAGVIFKHNDHYKWPLAINFQPGWWKPTLTMPILRINSSTELVLFNLIAYEQDIVIHPYFRSYVAAMMNLLETKEDHLKLVDLNIARHDMKFAKNIPLGSQHVVDLIHNLSQGYDLYEFLYAEDWYRVYKYCNGKLGWTRRTYFSNAWSYIASLSGLIIFILTAIQTYSSIYLK